MIPVHGSLGSITRDFKRPRRCAGSPGAWSNRVRGAARAVGSVVPSTRHHDAGCSVREVNRQGGERVSHREPLSTPGRRRSRTLHGSSHSGMQRGTSQAGASRCQSRRPPLQAAHSTDRRWRPHRRTRASHRRARPRRLDRLRADHPRARCRPRSSRSSSSSVAPMFRSRCSPGFPRVRSSTSRQAA